MITRLKIRLPGDTAEFREIWRPRLAQTGGEIGQGFVEILKFGRNRLTVYKDWIEGEIILVGPDVFQDISPTFSYSRTYLSQDADYMCLILNEAEVVGYEASITLPICCSPESLISRMSEHDALARELITCKTMNILTYQSEDEQFLAFDANRYMKQLRQKSEKADPSGPRISLRHVVRRNAESLFRNMSGQKDLKDQNLLLEHLYQPEAQAIIVRRFFHQYRMIEKLALSSSEDEPDCIEELERDIIAAVNRLLEK